MQNLVSLNLKSSEIIKEIEHLLKELNVSDPEFVNSDDLYSPNHQNSVNTLIVEYNDDIKNNSDKLSSLKSNYPETDIIFVKSAKKRTAEFKNQKSKLISSGILDFLILPDELNILRALISKSFDKQNLIKDLKDDFELKDSILYEINEIISELDLKSLIRKLINHTLVLTNSNVGAIYLIENGKISYYQYVNENNWLESDENSEQLHFDTKLLEQHSKLIINKKKAVKEFCPSPLFELDKLSSYLCVPLLSREGNIMGLFEVGKTSGNYDDEKDFYIVQNLSKTGSKVIENITLLNYTKNKADVAKSSELIYRSLLENTPYFILIVQHNQIKFINKTTIDSLGYSRHEISNKNILEFIAPENRDDFLELIRRVLLQKGFEQADINLITEDGKHISISAEVSHCQYGNEKAVQILAREVSDGLEDSNEALRLAAAVNSLHSAVTITDMNRNIIYVNPAHTKCFGYQLDELIGKNSSILSAFEDPSGISEKIYDAILMVGWEGERICIRRNREVFPVYEKISVVKDQDGLPIGIVSIADEITERKRLEQALRESEERYRTLVETAKTAIIATDESGDISLYNPSAERIFEFKKDEVIGAEFTTLIPEQFRELITEGFKRSESPELTPLIENTIELIGMKKSGEEFPIEVSLSTCTLEGKKIRTAIILDITERKNLQGQLIQSAKLAAVGELISGVTHEVNNPLAVVMGYAEMTLAEPNLSEEAKNSIKVILSESERARKVIRNLLSFARQHNPDKEIVSINEIIDTTLSLTEFDLKKNGVKVVKEYDPKLPTIMADPNQLQQVFLNLIINAQQAISEHKDKGQILIVTNTSNGVSKKKKPVSKDNSVIIKFIDNGPGIPEKQLNKIFDPFFTTKPVGKGTGLGLSVSFGIIKEHGGKIHADSKEGYGTTFHIELPIGQKKPENKTKAKK